MGIIAWTVPALDTGPLASMRIPGRRPQDLCVIGAVGTLPGSWARQ
jgi:hypothetical protein